jgi:hypothetical protein
MFTSLINNCDWEYHVYPGGMAAERKYTSQLGVKGMLSQEKRMICSEHHTLQGCHTGTREVITSARQRGGGH